MFSTAAVISSPAVREKARAGPLAHSQWMEDEDIKALLEQIAAGREESEEDETE